MILRDAAARDLLAIVALLADDDTARAREDVSEPLDPHYRAAFDAINADPNQRLIVAEIDGRTVGTMQIRYPPGLSFRGAWRQQIEAVRIVADLRGRGLGAGMIRWAIAQARARDCTLVQLTSSAGRHAAHRFYERLGFARSHVGMKLYLDD